MSDVLSEWGAASTRSRKTQNDAGYDFIASRRSAFHRRKSASKFMLDSADAEEDPLEGSHNAGYFSEDSRVLLKLAQLESRRHFNGDDEFTLVEPSPFSPLLVRTFVGGFIIFVVGVLATTVGILLDLFVFRAVGSLLAAVGACAVAGALIQGQHKKKQKA